MGVFVGIGSGVAVAAPAVGVAPRAKPDWVSATVVDGVQVGATVGNKVGTSTAEASVGSATTSTGGAGDSHPTKIKMAKSQRRQRIGRNVIRVGYSRHERAWPLN